MTARQFGLASIGLSRKDANAMPLIGCRFRAARCSVLVVLLNGLSAQSAQKTSVRRSVGLIRRAETHTIVRESLMFETKMSWWE